RATTTTTTATSQLKRSQQTDAYRPRSTVLVCLYGPGRQPRELCRQLKKGVYKIRYQPLIGPNLNGKNTAAAANTVKLSSTVTAWGRTTDRPGRAEMMGVSSTDKIPQVLLDAKYLLVACYYSHQEARANRDCGQRGVPFGTQPELRRRIGFRSTALLGPPFPANSPFPPTILPSFPASQVGTAR
ncbi:hypothetical protein BaRGS_00025638, partial [Batillaria attramentaria]